MHLSRSELRGISSDGARYRRALSSWQAGEYDRCLRLLDEIPIDRHDSESILLRARSLIRVNRLPEAKAWLTLNAARHRHEDAVATSAMLVGSVYAQMRDFEQADRCFEVVERVACHHTIGAECNYLRAMSRYLAGDLDGAKRFGKLALRPGEDIVSARTRSLFGWIAIAQCDYPCAYAEFLGSLDVLDRCRADDTHLRASIVSALAIAGAEAQIGGPELLDAEIAKVHWNPSLVQHQVQALRHCGFAYETSGDNRTAMLRHAAAAEVAPGTVWAIYGYSACANLALRRGQLEAAEAFAFLATSVERRISDTVGWQGIEDEQRISLLELALILARLGNIAEARRCRDLYNDEPQIAVLSSLHHDLRLSTYKRHVDAMTEASFRSEIESTGTLRGLIDQWTAIGCPRRAHEALADVACVEARTTVDRNADPPRAEATTPHMSRRDLAIVQLVAAGLSNAEIADKLQIASKTVKNRIVQIYKAYGVHDRTNLALLGLERHLDPACAHDGSTQPLKRLKRMSQTLPESGVSASSGVA